MDELIKKVFFYTSRNTIIQFLRYSMVGGVSAVADISVFYMCITLFHLNYIIANTLSFVIGVITNYLLSREWVFNDKEHRIFRDFILYSIIGLIGLFLSNIILYILIDLKFIYLIISFYNSNFAKLIAKLLAICIVLFWNFIARKKLVFNSI